MPTYLPPRQGISMSLALAEARASATVGDPALTTIALYHPSFRDDAGNAAAIYAVNDWTKLVATIEAGAPLHGGTAQTFVPIPFHFSRPDELDAAAPNTVTLTISNVAREVSEQIEAAIESMEPVTLIARTYFRSDTSAPHETPPLRLTVGAVRASAEAVTAQAGFGDLTNRKFPAVDYLRHQFQGLEG